MPSYGAVIVSRNDDYGFNLLERATYCLNSMISELDQVVYIDWATDMDKPDLVTAIQKDLITRGNLFYTRITPDVVKEIVPPDPDVQKVCEVFSRNIGIRKLQTDFKVSTNIDIICPERHLIELENNEATFYTAGKRNMPIETLRQIGRRKEIDVVRKELYRIQGNYNQQPRVKILDGDDFSLVSGCGDWQLAHKVAWDGIKGFEERLYRRMCADTNIHRKASIFGYAITVDWNLPVWHIDHGGGAGGGGGANDPFLAVYMLETTNTETWGSTDKKFTWDVL